MFGKRTVWIINQMYIRAILRKGLLFISNHGLMSDMCQQKGAPKNLKPKPTTAFARKISRGIDKLFDDPKLVAQRFSIRGD